MPCWLSVSKQIFICQRYCMLGWNVQSLWLSELYKLQSRLLLPHHFLNARNSMCPRDVFAR
jgi:hypothetical protein